MNKNIKREFLKTNLKKIALHCAGEKNKNTSEAFTVPEPSPNIFFPHISVTSEQAPELKGKEVGEEVKLVVSGKITNHNLREGKDNSHEDFGIDIMKIGLIKSK